MPSVIGISRIGMPGFSRTTFARSPFAEVRNTSVASFVFSATITSSTVADIALGLGGVAFVTGVVMVVLAPPPGRATSASSATLRVAPQLGPGANGLLLQGSF